MQRADGKAREVEDGPRGERGMTEPKEKDLLATTIMVKSHRTTQRIYEVFIVNSLKNVTYFSLCEKTEKEHFIQTSFKDGGQRA